MPERTLRQVAGRILVAFGLYLGLLGLWLGLGLDRRYDDGVERLAVQLLDRVGHFPIGATELTPVRVHNQGYALVLALALASVVGLPWRARVARYGTLAGVLIASQVLAMAVQLHLAQALRFEERSGLPLLLPWELAVERGVFRLLHAVGLQVAPFLLVLLTALWLSGRGVAELFGETPAPKLRGTGRSSGRRRWLVATAATLVVAMLAVAAAGRIRERDPRHVQLHVVIGDALARQGMPVVAESEFRAALRGDVTNGPAWYGLASLFANEGRIRDSDAVIERALGHVQDPGWRARLVGRTGTTRRAPTRPVARE